MPGIGHFYITAHGNWQVGPWIGETAQIGMRWTMRARTPSDPGPIITLPDLGPATPVFEERTITAFNVTQTFDCDVPGGGGAADWSIVCDDLVEDFDTFLGTLTQHQCAKFRWTAIKVAPIEKGTGKYLAPATIYTYKTPKPGIVNTQMPPENAVCLSLRTAIVGKRGRGRIYVPALDPGVGDADGLVATAVSDAWATSFRLLVSAMQNVPGIDQGEQHVLICSGNSTTAVTPREVRVGNHIDVQRRRQHQVQETYKVLPIA